MASQEFLASFAVEIDEGGVSRLQSVLSDYRDLANEVAAAFSAATAAIKEYETAAAGDTGGSGEGNRNTGSASAAQITRSNSNVSAPVTIQVHSTGASAEQIGQNLYDTAEGYLLRTLRSAFPL